MKATIIVIGSFIVVEILAELVMTIVWTMNVKHHVIRFTVFAATFVYYCPGIFSVYKVVEKYYLCYKKVHEPKNSDGCTHIEEVKNDSESDIEQVKNYTRFKCFVWIIAYFEYIILYSFFPAFVLAFAYPTRVITIFAFMATFLVSSIVYLTTYLKKDLTLKIFDQDITGFTKDIFSIILIISLPYFFLLIFALLYSLVIGRASVVSSAPLALLSLLPSILISIAVWAMKSTVLKNDNDTSIKSCSSEDGGVNKELKEARGSKEAKQGIEVTEYKGVIEENEIEEIDRDGEVTKRRQQEGASSSDEQEEDK